MDIPEKKEECKEPSGFHIKNVFVNFFTIYSPNLV